MSRPCKLHGTSCPRKAGAPPQVDQDPPLAAALSRRPFPRCALRPESYVARIGLVRHGIVDVIRAEMHQNFPGVTASLLESRDPAVILCYAHLQKDLPFRTRFEVLKEPLVFHGTAGSVTVQSFGVKQLGEAEADSDLFKHQVTVLDYDAHYGCVLSLRHIKDEIILPNVQPKSDSTASLPTS